MQHWSVVLNIVEQGLAGEKEQVRAYSQLLLQRLEKDPEYGGPAYRLRNILNGEKGQVIGLAEQEAAEQREFE